MPLLALSSSAKFAPGRKLTTGGRGGEGRGMGRKRREGEGRKQGRGKGSEGRGNGRLAGLACKFS